NPREEATGSPLILNPERGFASAQITRQSIEPVSLQLRNFNAVLNTNSELWKAQRIAENKLLLIFTNTISFIGDELDLAGFAVTFGLDDLIIYAAEITENPRPELIITTQNLNEFNEIVIKYDSELGNLLGMASHNPVESFNYILNL
ncbi:MAG: hypothetical protein FWE74_10955, partial [Oscillospiraceae bacterium]|nr:hypothetical protein [Oscillospiraceae bacterium]